MDGSFIAKELAKMGISQIPKISEIFWQAAKDYVSSRDLFNYTKKYIDSLEADHSFMQILGMEKPIPIYHIYTEVFFRTRIRAKTHKTIEELVIEARTEIRNKGIEVIKEDVEFDIKKELLLSKINLEYNLKIKEVNQKLKDLRNNAYRQKDQVQGSIDQHEVEKQRIVKKKASLINERKKAKANIRSIVEKSTFSDGEMIAIRQKVTLEVERRIESQANKKVDKKVANVSSNTNVYGFESQMPALDAIYNRDRILILGQPGAGKTTFLKHILLRNIQDIEPNSRIPIFVNLKEYADEKDIDIFNFIVNLFDSYSFPNAKDFLERLLKLTNSCVLLFDGLDEVPKNVQKKIVNQIISLSRKYRKNQIIVSCRTANYSGQLEGFSEFEIADFGMPQIEKFVNGWFDKSERDARQFIRQVKRNPGLSQLTTTPLLLALLCITYKRVKKFPDQRSLLYSACIDALFIDWDSSRNVERESLIKGFDYDSKKLVLGKFACDTFCEEQQFFLQNDIVDRFNEYSKVLPLEANQGYSMLKEFMQFHGILVEKANRIYAFSHLTLHEFFCALHISRNATEVVFEILSDEIWSDLRWKEVISFIGGLLPSADIFLMAMRNLYVKKLCELNLLDYLKIENLPSPAITFIDERIDSESKSLYECLFRVKIIRNRFNRVFDHHTSYVVNQHFEEILKSLELLINSERDKNIYNKPFNVALKQSLYEYGYSDKQKTLVHNNIQVVISYLRMLSISLNILSSRARLSPSIKLKLVQDYFNEGNSIWTYTQPKKINRLGI